jgi:hypothetical protein
VFLGHEALVAVGVHNSLEAVVAVGSHLGMPVVGNSLEAVVVVVMVVVVVVVVCLNVPA